MATRRSFLVRTCAVAYAACARPSQIRPKARKILLEFARGQTKSIVAVSGAIGAPPQHSRSIAIGENAHSIFSDL